MFMLAAAKDKVGRFCSRHKKKLLGGAVAAGVGYAAWRYFVPKVQERLFNKLLDEFAKEMEGDAAEAEEQRRRDRFAHKQQVSDEHGRRKLAVLRQRLADCFLVDACQAAVATAGTREEKLEAFRALQAEVLAKATASLHALHAVLLLHRIGFNMVGREMHEGAPLTGDGETGASEPHAAFLAALDAFMGHSLEDLAKATRRAATGCLQKLDLALNAPVDVKTIQELVGNCFREADVQLMKEGPTADSFFPASLDDQSGVATTGPAETKRLLDEARDYVDSPQFRLVLQGCVLAAAASFAEALRVEAVAAGAPEDGTLPLAKFTGPLAKVAGDALDAGEGEDSACTDGAEGGAGAGGKQAPSGLGAGLVSAFARREGVEDFCRIIYFQEPGGVVSGKA